MAGVLMGDDPHTHRVSNRRTREAARRLRVRAASRQADGLLRWAETWSSRTWVRSKAEVGAFCDGVDSRSTDEQSSECTSPVYQALYESLAAR